MQVQSINNSINFGHKIKFDPKIVSRATKEEKAELASLKYKFKYNGFKDEIIVKNNKNQTIQNIIEKLRAEYEKYESERIMRRKLEDAFGDEKYILK